MRQADVFLDGEGRAWLDRNVSKLGNGDDPVLAELEAHNIRPRNVLEIGCANGWRLEALLKKYGCGIVGVDPTPSPLSYIGRGTADKIRLYGPLHHKAWSVSFPYDVVIYGWCLYLCDPEDYFKIAAEGDRVLEDGGFLVIHDFYSYVPHKNKYKHKSGLFSHKMDFANLWLSHPAYSLYSRSFYGDDDDTTTVTILKKNTKNAFQVRK